MEKKQPPKPITIDHFGDYRFLHSLKTDGRDRISFEVRQANFDENRYDNALWLFRRGDMQQFLPPGRLGGHWWCGPGAILADLPVECTPGAGQAAKEAADDLSGSALQRLPLCRMMPKPGTDTADADAMDSSAQEKQDAPVRADLPQDGPLQAIAPGPAEWQARFAHDVLELEALPDGRLLLVLDYDPKVAAALGEADGEAVCLAADAGLPADAARRLKVATGCEELERLPVWENGDGLRGGKRRALFLLEAGAQAARRLSGPHTEVEHVRLAPSGRTAWFFAKTYTGPMPVASRLMQLDLETLAQRDVGYAGEMRCDGFAVLDEQTLLVAGSTMAQYGLNENPHFYRVHTKTEEWKLINADGALDYGNAVTTDVNMAAEPRMVADGLYVYFIATMGANSRLWRIHAKTGAISQVSGATDLVSEFVRVNGRCYFIAVQAFEGPELYVVNDEGQQTRVTRFNFNLMEEYAWSGIWQHRFFNQNGDLIEGWLLPPMDRQPGKRYPGVLYIHGGPRMAYGEVPYHELQYLTARGYAVFFCNPTGSAGRGGDFGDLRGRYGTVDYNDLLAYTDVVLNYNKWIDPARLGVCGGSYGGFMVNWIITHTNRFAAAVSQRGIASWQSMYLQSDIGWYFVQDQMGGNPWDDAEALWEASPLKHARQAKTPTLFIHSEEDYRCPMAEGLQMYTALKLQGVPARLCLFHGENHELSRGGKPENRVRRLREICAWLDRYLQPETGAAAQDACVQPGDGMTEMDV